MTRLLKGLGRNVLALSAVSFCTYFSGEMITPLLPLFLIRELRGGASALGMIEGISDCTSSLTRLLSGWVSDRRRKRKGFVLLGYAISGVALPLLAFATAAWHLGAVRLVDRFGKGFRLAPRDALIVESCEPSHRAKAFGLLQAMDNLGGICGIVTVWLLMRRFPGSMRSMFLLTVIPAACSLAVIPMLLRDRKPAEPRAVLQLTLAPYKETFRRFLMIVIVFTLGNSSDLFLLLRMNALGVSSEWIPIVWAGHLFLRMIAAVPAGVMADAWGRRPVVIAGWVLYAGVYAGFAYATTLPVILALMAAYSLYSAMSESVLRAIVPGLVPPEHRATAYGLYHFTLGVTILPANLLFGLLWNTAGPGTAFLTAAGFAFAAAVLLATLGRSMEDR